VYADIYDRKVYRDEKGALHFLEAGTLPVSAALRELAAQWHGGQGSALYSLSSVGSIASETHKVAILRELREDLAWVERMLEHPDYPDRDGLVQSQAELRAFITFVEGTFHDDVAHPA
jgi:hypothetical protein